MKKFLALSLAFILLISNFGLTMASHFCEGERVKSQLMVGHHQLGCGMPGMDTATEPVPKEGETPLKSSGCCENHYQTLEIEDGYKTGKTQFSVNLEFAVALVHSFLDRLPLSETGQPQYANYLPPLLLRDISVLNQVFII